MEQTETAAPVETPAPDAPLAPVEDAGSLADHERAYHPDAESRAPAAAADPEPAAEPGETERDEKGQFKPRHRAKSQQASPDDVPRIKELTRRLRETEAELERVRTAAPAPPKADLPAAAAPAPKPAAAVEKFPTYDEWVAKEEHKDGTYDDYADARADWRYDLRRRAERAAEQQDAAQRTYQQHVQTYLDALPEVQQQYPDFDTVVNPASGPIRVSKAVEIATIQAGPAAAYYLATHADEREALTADTAIDPSNPAFAAVVATTRRYLTSLVAAEQRRASSPSRAAAATTGSALALVPPSVPKPPNPVRTGALRDGEAMPSDDSSLADHERAFGPGRRRA